MKFLKRFCLLTATLLINTFVLAQENSSFDFHTLMQQGNAAFNDKDYAKANYCFETALKMDQESIEAIKMKYKVDEIFEKNPNIKNSIFENIVIKGEEYYLDGYYEQAQTLFLQALSLNHESQFIKDRLTSIGRVYTNPIHKQFYLNSINTGDQLMKEKKYRLAIAEYEKAYIVKPNDRNVKAIIEDAIFKLNEVEDNEVRINDLLAAGDRLFEKNEFELALFKYKAVSKMVPENAKVLQKISETENIITKRIDIQANYDKAIKDADSLYINKFFDASALLYQEAIHLKPDAGYPKEMLEKANKAVAEQKSIDEKYFSLIASADKLFDLKDYQNAITSYKSAAKIKPEEKYPKIKISEIEEIFAEARHIEENYNKSIEKADDFYLKQKWEEALAEYSTAIKLKPSEKLPAQRIAEIKDFMAQKAETELKYIAAIDKADSLFNKKLYENSIVAYKDALAIKQGETYPRKQIAEAEKLITEQKDAIQRYNSLIATADGFAESNKLEDAISSYKEALKIKPDETYPKEKISTLQAIINKNAETDRLYNEAISLADNFFNNEKYHEALEPYYRALTIKPDETYPNSKITEINQIIKDIENREKEYNSILSEADKNFENKMYSEALSGYKSLNKLNSNDEYVIGRISETENILSDIEAKNKAYNQNISEANSLFEQKQYSQAIAAYNKALEYKPNDKFTSDRIEEINTIIADIDKNYNLFIEAGDLAFENKDYDLAIEKYESASELKPKEEYPKKQISDIKAKKQAIIDEINNKYNALISTADGLMLIEDYDEAINYYNKALEVKPSESYPNQQISKINTLLEKIKAQRSEEFNAAIAKADNLYKNKIYDQAIEAYESAILIVPTDKYPHNQIAKIRKHLADHAIINIANQNIVVNVGDEHKFDFNVVEFRLRKNNYLIIKAKAADNSNPNIFINYGKDGIKNGGFVIRDIKSGEYSEYLIGVSAQTKWQREDNNWIIIFSEGGKVEISDIQLSIGD